MITKTYLREKAAQMQSYLPGLVIEWAYGQPRCYLSSGAGRSELSPRLPTGKMDLWLNALDKGWGMGFWAGHQAGVKEAVKDSKESLCHEGFSNFPTFSIALDITNSSLASAHWQNQVDLVIFDSKIPFRDHPDWDNEHYVKFVLTEKLKRSYDSLNKGRLPELVQWVIDSVVVWEEIAEELVEKYRDLERNKQDVQH